MSTLRKWDRLIHLRQLDWHIHLRILRIRDPMSPSVSPVLLNQRSSSFVTKKIRGCGGGRTTDSCAHHQANFRRSRFSPRMASRESKTHNFNLTPVQITRQQYLRQKLKCALLNVRSVCNKSYVRSVCNKSYSFAQFVT